MLAVKFDSFETIDAEIHHLKQVYLFTCCVARGNSEIINY